MARGNARALRPAPEFDRILGLDWYVTEAEPCGGVIKSDPNDFVVEEVLTGGVVVSTSGVILEQRPGPWLWVHVVKRGVDSIKLLVSLERALRLGRGEIGVGGIKDAKAVTSQIISIYGAKPGDLPHIPGVEYRGFWAMDKPISPAGIEGNKFTIVVRDLDVECAEGALARLAGIKLPNYYGYQRFGTIRPVSHLLGKALVRRDPDAFLDAMFCKIFDAESPRVKEARGLACRGMYAEALSKMPRGMMEERALLRALASGRNKWNSIMSIPRRILKMYIEAYQSYIFNKALSARVEAAGLEPIDEDVFLKDEEPLAAASPPPGAAPALPIPGPGIRIPNSKARDLLIKILSAEGVALGDFAVPKLGVSGSYRRIAVVPEGFSWRAEPGSILLTFKLPRGSYATIVLRELIKPEVPHLHGF